MTSHWWTTEEKLQTAKQSYSLAVAAAKLNERAPHLYDWVNWKCFRLGSLEKYKNNDLCEVGNNHISFLDLQEDKDRQIKIKTPVVASTAKFYYTNIEDTILMKAEDYLNIPPTERNHWQQHEIPIKLESKRVD